MQMAKYYTKKQALSTSNKDNSLKPFSKDDFSLSSIQNLIKELSKLNKQGLISDERFSKLVAMACATYIETEVEDRIIKMIDRSMFHIFKF